MIGNFEADPVVRQTSNGVTSLADQGFVLLMQNAENPFISIRSIDVETEVIFTSIEILEETQQEFIEAFKIQI